MQNIKKSMSLVEFMDILAKQTREAGAYAAKLTIGEHEITVSLQEMDAVMYAYNTLKFNIKPNFELNTLEGYKAYAVYLEKEIKRHQKNIRSNSDKIKYLEAENYLMKFRINNYDVPAAKDIKLAQKLEKENLKLRFRIDELRRELKYAESRPKKIDSSSIPLKKFSREEAIQILEKWLKDPKQIYNG